MNPTPREKYAARFQELEALHHELETGKRPGDGAVVVGLLLEAAGDVLRRRGALSVDEARIMKHLGAAPETGVRAWGDGVALAEVATRLRRAAAQAVEAALPDTPETGASMAQWALQDLQARDRLESALVALEQLAAAGRGDAKALVARLRAAVGKIDADCRPSAPSLTALNDARRAEAALLDGEARARAWWFSDRSGLEDDLLVKVLGGETNGTVPPELAGPSRAVSRKRRRPVSSDDLFRFDLGLASPAERETVRRQAEADPELKLALAAMEAADAAIDEVTSDAAPRIVPVPLPVERSASEPEVLEERSEFKVLLFRTRQQVQVVVQPRRVDRFATAAVYRSDAPDRPLASTPGELGVHFDLGAPERVAGSRARVVVKLTDGQTHALEVTL